MTYTQTTLMRLIKDACQIARERLDLNVSRGESDEAYQLQVAAYEAALAEVETVFKESF